jgi:cobalt/nickel transport system permease protein
MAFYGCFVGYFLIWRPIMRSNWFSGMGERAAQRMRILVASILGCVTTLQLGAFSVVLETTLSGITELPFSAFVALMQPIHLAIGLVEGLITAAVLTFVHESRPELLRDVKETEGSGKFSLKGTLAILAVVVVLVGGGLSLLASSNPDGLEWALFGNEEGGYGQNMGLDEEDFGVKSDAADTAESIQESTSFLPDYAFPDSENPIGTTVSGIVGSLMVAAVAVGICLLGGFFRRKNRAEA